MTFIAKNSGVSGVPKFPENGEGDGRPNVDVEADRRWGIPNEVDGVRWLQPQEGPDLCRASAKDGEVRRILMSDVALRTVRARGEMVLRCKFAIVLSLLRQRGQLKILTLIGALDPQLCPALSSSSWSEESNE